MTEEERGLDIAALAGDLREAGVAGEIGLRHLEMGHGALERLPALARLLSPDASAGPVVVLGDGVPKMRGGQDATDLALRLLSGDGEVRHAVVRAHGTRLHADPATLDSAASQAAGARCLVTVGSGTMADVGKAVSARLGGVPHVVVQTALSVNGFADDQSVLLLEGVKRTTPSRWPDALVADTGILAEAPLELNLAGVGDLAAMFTAPADWLLAFRLGMGDGYSEPLVGMVRRHGDAVLHAAPGLRRRDPRAIETVAKVLTLSGISMGLAGTTAPASGMEHTVSHLVEMAMNVRGHDAAFHGAQVGAATVLASVAWKRVRRMIAAGSPELRFPSEGEMEGRVRAAFDRIDPSRAMGEECWRLYRRKLARWNSLRPAIAATDWAFLDHALSPLLVEPAGLASALARSGAPAGFEEMEPSIEAGTVRWALANCHLMRDRFTVADLAFFLGAWEPADVEAVMSEALAMGART